MANTIKEVDGKKVEKPFTNKKGKSFKHRKTGSKFKKPDDKITATHTDNDVAWYTKYRELADNVARVAMNHRNGSQIALDMGGVYVEENIDPIITMGVLFNPGNHNSRSDGINIASDAMHKMLNRRFRGVYSRYQSSDIGISQIGILDFFAGLSEAYRAYGLALTYKLNQRQMPRNLLIALHIDPESMVNKLAEFRYRLNQLALRARNLCLVRGYSAMEHWLFLMNNVFKDKDTERANMFGYYRPGYWKWNPTDLKTGSALQYIQYKCHSVIKKNGTSDNQSGLRTVEDFLDGLTDQLEALLTDDDVDQICSDILAFYGNKDDSADLVKVGYLPEDYTVDPIYSLTECKQFHNSKTFGYGSYCTLNNIAFGTNNYVTGYCSPVPLAYFNTVPSLPSVWIYQDDNNVIHFDLEAFSNVTSNAVRDTTAGATEFRFGASGTVLTGYSNEKVVIDDDITDPSPDEIMEITRQSFNLSASQFSVSNTTYYYLRLGDCGSVVPLGFEVYNFYEPMTFASNAITGLTYDPGTKNVVSRQFNNGLSYNTWKILSAISKFDWHPIFIKNDSGVIDIVGDLDNYKSFDHMLIKDIHAVALLSEFKNPISDFIIKE